MAVSLRAGAGVEDKIGCSVLLTAIALGARFASSGMRFVIRLKFPAARPATCVDPSGTNLYVTDWIDGFGGPQ